MGWWMDKLAAEDPQLVRGQAGPPKPEPQTADDYLDRARQNMQVVRPATVDERYSGSIEYRTWDGQKFSVPQRTAGDIVNVPTSTKTWEVNSWNVKTDVGVLGSATPQELAAAHQLAARDGRFTEVNTGQLYRDAAKVTADVNSGVYLSSNARQMPTRSAPPGTR